MTLISDFIAGRSPAAVYETYLVPGMFTPWAEQLLERLPPTGDCLDIACGTGIISRGIAKCGAATSITAGDLAPPMLDVARAEAARQSRYLSTYVEPTLAEESEYPQRFVIFGLAAFFLLLSWSVMALIYYSIRDRS